MNTTKKKIPVGCHIVLFNINVKLNALNNKYVIRLEPMKEIKEKIQQ
jgi:hypothetical protein